MQKTKQNKTKTTNFDLWPVTPGFARAPHFYVILSIFSPLVFPG